MKHRHSLLGACSLVSAGLFAFAFLIGQGRRQEALLILLAGLAGAAALLYLPVQKKKEADKKKREALERDYSQMVTLLSLYMTAGLTLRSSWEEIVKSYEEDKKSGREAVPVYEEMLITWRDIKGGMYEDRAYGAFGRRCCLPPYLRLGGLLETYVRQGNKELLLLLEQEASASLVQALQEVRKKGEKTGTRLLIPLILLFALTLLIVMVPAFMSLKAGL